MIEYIALSYILCFLFLKFVNISFYIKGSDEDYALKTTLLVFAPVTLFVLLISLCFCILFTLICLVIFAMSSTISLLRLNEMFRRIGRFLFKKVDVV